MLKSLGKKRQCKEKLKTKENYRIAKHAIHEEVRT
jgi:hypothetical protein